MNLMKLLINVILRENNAGMLWLNAISNQERKMDLMEPTLCLPDLEKTCFACCPPIRSEGYEHIQYRNIIKRMLLENNALFAAKEKGISPIVGFSCWALGYLDKKCKLVGCLLHPGQNEGVDLRYRVDYGNKCLRESCREAGVFLQLKISERKFWLQLSDGLDSFAYSSKKNNPLFNMIGWGVDILGLIASKEKGRLFSCDSFFETYPFFSTRLNQWANAYLLKRFIWMNGADVLKTDGFRVRLEVFSDRLSEYIRKEMMHKSGAMYTHLLDLDHNFLDFLRLSAGISKIDREEALSLQQIVNRELQGFSGSESFR